jgi:hypothetical protein
MPRRAPLLAPEAIRFRHRASVQRVDRSHMLAVQEDRKLLSDRFPFGCDGGFKQVMLGVLRQIAPASGDRLSKGACQLVCGRGRKLPMSQQVGRVDRALARLICKLNDGCGCHDSLARRLRAGTGVREQ